MNRFSKLDIDAGSREYLRFHARRFSYLVDAVSVVARQNGQGQYRILDIGPSFQTVLFRDALPEATINTFGIQDYRFAHRPGEEHFALDLNDTQYPEHCPPPAIEHDILVMAEVIEHLYTAPHLVLRYLAGWLKPGGVLLIQTPNAVSLAKRLAILRGKNPFEMIRDQRVNPGHFREYTVDELRVIASRSGFQLERVECRNYFDSPDAKSRLYRALCALTPGYVNDGITAWLRKIPR